MNKIVKNIKVQIAAKKIFSRQRHYVYKHNLILATINDYNNWLSKFFVKNPTANFSSHYDRPFNKNAKFLVATEDIINLEPGFGSGSINIIVPEGITVHHAAGLFTHNEIFYIKDGTTECERNWVPSYTDTTKISDFYETNKLMAYL